MPNPSLMLGKGLKGGGLYSSQQGRLFLRLASGAGGSSRGVQLNARTARPPAPEAVPASLSISIEPPGSQCEEERRIAKQRAGRQEHRLDPQATRDDILETVHAPCDRGEMPNGLKPGPRPFHGNPGPAP